MESQDKNTKEITIASLEAELDKMKVEQAEYARIATADELTRQLESERTERAGERAEYERRLSELRSSKFIDDAKQKVSYTRDVNFDVQRAKIIREIGPAKWYGKPAAERLNTLGISDSEKESDARLNELFGPKSSSLKATQLMNSNPAQYRRLRAIFLERRSGK